MQWKGKVWALAAALILGCFAVPNASAQITTGTVAGTVKDTQGGVIPGATVVLTSQSRGTKSIPVVTNETGDWVIANVAADTYTVDVSMSGFKTTTRKDVAVSGGDRVVVGTLTLEVGGTTETVDVTAEAPMIQAQSGERSFTVDTTQVANLPVNRNNFADLARMAPGMGSGQSRLGSTGQNNLQMDGISAMDTGNNGQMLQLNIESIAEVKVLTQGYQAEYGRSSGTQITAVTKSGTNRFHGSLYDVERNSDWDTIKWQDKANGNQKPELKDRRWGYSIGGPIGKPGGNNKLFFFYSHEYHPQKTAGDVTRYRLPTALERQGDFSQSLDNTGKPIPQLLSPSTREPYPNNVIPQSDLYQVGLNVLNRYPLPNHVQQAGENYNTELERAEDKHLVQQPVIRVDYQLSPALRITGKYSAQRDQQRIRVGTLPGFNDVLIPYPYITNYGFTVDYTLNPTTFIEAVYGSIKNELAGGGSGGILVNDSANRLNGLADFPLLYPNAGKVDPRYYQLDALTRTGAIYFDGTSVNLPPLFSYGNLIASNANPPAPPNQQYPGWLNVNKTQDFAVSVTKVAGHHTMKAGFYNNHSFKAQNTGAGGAGSFQGNVDFGNDSNNPLDTGFGFANAAVGVFTRYQQASQLIEGNMIYNNTEFYLQDNWKVSPRLTLDYGMRFTHQGPQYDQFGQMSGFFPEQWNAASAPVLYVPACAGGVNPCASSERNAMNPLTGEILTIPNATNSSAFIGTVVPNSGDRLDGILAAGNGIAKTGYVWPSMVFGPRFGAAYDLSGDQRFVVRGGLGLFYDRPDGNTVFSIPSNPPFADGQDLRNGNLQDLANSVSTVGTPSMITFQYDADIPSSVQWNAGVQMVLPWSSSLDLSYVGSHGYNMLAGFQGGNRLDQNSIDLGAAYLPENQDPTKAPSSVPGASALPDIMLRTFRGLNSIGQNTFGFHEMYHSIQASLNRRFVNGLSFGVNYTLGLSFTGNTGLPNPVQRYEHTPDGTVSLRADNAQWEDLMKNLDNRRHTLVANAVWDLPDMSADSGGKRVVAAILNDWQLSGVLSAGSAGHYDLSYTYQSAGSSTNLTGSSSFPARIVYNGDAGSGCSSNQYAQFNASVVAGPTYHSDGMESGRNILQGCPNHTVDLALVRNFRLGGGRQAQVRVDAFNAFNVLVYNGRQTQLQLTNPTDQKIRNSQFLADGSIDPTRTQPKSAGFGGATSAQNMRTVQLTFRLSF
jgi:hypothetical protein